MARQKKIDFGFTPSEYQQKIFDFVQHGNGNGVIKARAGSGKTTTAVSAIKLIPKKEKCLYIAFNRSIVEELDKRLHNNTNVTVRTSHSIGYSMVKRNIGGDIDIDEFKYRTYLKHNIAELSSIDLMSNSLSRQDIENYVDNITDIINFGRLNLCQSVKELKDITIMYDIPIEYDECDVALKCMQWGKTYTSSIDYTDMIWLPYELKLKPIGMTYDWVFIDEAQDLSMASIQLFLKTFKRGARFIALGDDCQCINVFAGSSQDAFNYMCNLPNTQIFDLPISYRCDKTIIELANHIVPDIVSRDDAEDGFIIEESSIFDLKDGDMLIARAKSPLIKAYTKLLSKGVNCYIKGQEIGKALLDLLNKIDVEVLNRDLNDDGVFVRLYDRLFNERNKLMSYRGLDYDDATLSNGIINMYDSINSLITLSYGCTTKQELIDKINEIFAEEENGICLSTIHKAKGLEADNVYILCKSAMPSKLAKKDWEKQQELNLIYVGYTRAKHKLGFISEKEIPPIGGLLDPIKIIDELKYIDKKVCTILGKETMFDVNNVDYARFKLKSIKNIDNIHKEDNKIEIKKEGNTISMNIDDLMQFLKKN